MKKLSKISLFVIFALLLTSCEQIKHIEERASKINNYEMVSLQLAKENRELKVKLSEYESEIAALKTKNNFLTLQTEKGSGGARAIASIPSKVENTPGDVVKFSVYRWKPEQLHAMGVSEFEKKNYEASAQYFYYLTKEYPDSKLITDSSLFMGGLSAYETGKNPEWTLHSMKLLMDNYPTSSYYRGAKLWTALTNLKLGKKEEFFATVEEFRKKYRNTPEWKIISGHYEEILQKYKK